MNRFLYIISVLGLLNFFSTSIVLAEDLDNENSESEENDELAAADLGDNDETSENAEENTEEDIENDKESKNPKAKNNAQYSKFLSSFLNKELSDSIAYNIVNAEKVFCYVVDYPSNDNKGYTLDNLAIKGSCGELSEEGKEVITSSLLKNASIFSTNKEDCNISPQIMFRYINGIDSTDILLSSPCQSLTFFHGNESITLNAKPGKEIVDEVVSAYKSVSQQFLSPALLGQMVPNGFVLTNGQKELVRKKEAVPSAKKWQSGSNKTTETSSSVNSENNTTQNSTPQVAKGWNKLKK